MVLPQAVIDWAMENLTKRERQWILANFTEAQILYFVEKVIRLRRKLGSPTDLAIPSKFLLKPMLKTCSQCKRDNFRFRDKCIDCGARSFIPITDKRIDYYKQSSNHWFIF